jgi:hypothetical protein
MVTEMKKIKPDKGGNVGVKVKDVSESQRLKQVMVDRKKSLKQLTMLLLSLVLVMSAFATPVVAHDDDDDGVDDDLEELNERGVHVDIEPYEIEFESVLLNADVYEEIEVEIRSEDKIKVSIERSTHNGTAEPEIEAEVEFREIIEFVDSNGNGAYESGDDEISSFDLRDTEYNELDYTTATTADGETEHIVTAQTSNGIFRVVLHAVGDFAVIESGVISPSEIKLDLIIEDYPYEEDNTQLALMAKLETEAEVDLHDDDEDDEEDDEDELKITAPEAEAFFSWANNATVDGQVTPVYTTIVPDENGKKIFFAYTRGTSINHDPKLGVPYLTLPSDTGVLIGANLIPYALALVVGSVVVGSAVLWRKKKNGQVQP